MTGDDDSLAPLNFIEKLRQMGFGFGSLYFAHKSTTSCFDWSIIAGFRRDAKIGKPLYERRDRRTFFVHYGI
jgi:hypothetical protein